MSTSHTYSEWLAAKFMAAGILPQTEAPAQRFGDAYVRAGDRDIRARGLEYNAQLALGDALDDAENLRGDSHTSEVNQTGFNYTKAARRK